MTVGVAMLARNSADILPAALAPFAGRVDEIAILLGGLSTDNTAVVASEFADRLGIYDGPTDDAGGLLDFAHARQQSFDLLSTKYALVVDCDDRWQDTHNLPQVIAEAEAEARDGVLFPYDTGPTKFAQPRLFRRDAGKWINPVHEVFQYHSAPYMVRDVTTDAMSLRQEKPEAEALQSIYRNIRIAEYWLTQGVVDLRLMLGLSREYVMIKEPQKSLDLSAKILANFQPDTDKLFQVHYTRASAYLCLDEYEAAMGAISTALKSKATGHGYTMLAQIAYFQEMYDLVIWAADKALAMGRESAGAPLSNVTYSPFHLKAQAMAVTGHLKPALAALDLGIMLGGGDDMKRFRYYLCEKLGELP